MQRQWDLAAYISEFLSSGPSIPEASQTTDKVLEPADVRALLQERSWNCSKSLLDCMLGLEHSGSEYHGLTWIILLIMAVLLILVIPLTICAWQTLRTRKRTVSQRREDGSHESEMLQAGQSKVQQLEDCVASGTSDVLKDEQYMEEIQKEKIVELEERILKMECDQASLKEENVHLQKLNETLQEKRKTLQEKHKTVQGKYETLQGKYETLQEKCQVLQNQDQAEQRRRVEEQNVMEIRSAEADEDVRKCKQKIQEMNEVASHQKTQKNPVVAPVAEQAHELKRKEQACLTKKRPEVSAKVLGSRQPLDKVCPSLPSQQIRPLRKCCGVSKKTTETIGTNNKSIHVESTDHLGRCQCEAALVAGRIKANHQEEKIRAQEKDYEALRREKVMLERQVKCLLVELSKMSKKFLEKDQDLLRKDVQVKFERQEKELKVKEVLKFQKEMQAIRKQHQKAEISYKAEIASFRRALDKLMKTCSRPSTVPQNQMTIEVKLSNATQKEKNILLDTLQSERRTTQDLKDPEDVSHLSQIEVLPPETFTSYSKAGTSPSNASGAFCSSLENLAISL